LTDTGNFGLKATSERVDLLFRSLIWLFLSRWSYPSGIIPVPDCKLRRDSLLRFDVGRPAPGKKFLKSRPEPKGGALEKQRRNWEQQKGRLA